MIKNSQMTKELVKNAALSGLESLRGKFLAVQVKDIIHDPHNAQHGHKVVLVAYVLDENKKVLVRLTEVELWEGDRLLLHDIDQAFNITLSFPVVDE